MLALHFATLVLAAPHFTESMGPYLTLANCLVLDSSSSGSEGLQVSHARVEIQSRYCVIGRLAVIALISVWPLRSAHAYVDPNTAGPLYQFLFPMVVAIASVIAAGRRALRRLWNRLVARFMGTRPETALEHSRSNEEGP